MKKLAIWLNEHAICIGDSLKANVVHLWCIVITFALMTLFGALGWKGKAFEYLCMALFLGGSVLPPIVAGIVALVKKQPWTPWYWFPVVLGCVFGGLLAIVVGLIFGWCSIW